MVNRHPLHKKMRINKIEDTPILKLAMVKRFKVLCKPKIKSTKYFMSICLHLQQICFTFAYICLHWLTFALQLLTFTYISLHLLQITPFCVGPIAVLRSSVRSHAAHAIVELKKKTNIFKQYIMLVQNFRC